MLVALDLGDLLGVGGAFSAVLGGAGSAELAAAAGVGARGVVLLDVLGRVAPRFGECRAPSDSDRRREISEARSAAR